MMVVAVNNAEEEGPPARCGGEYRASHHERACRELVGAPTQALAEFEAYISE